jgi:hypothetical protein
MASMSNIGTCLSIFAPGESQGGCVRPSLQWGCHQLASVSAAPTCTQADSRQAGNLCSKRFCCNHTLLSAPLRGLHCQRVLPG